VSQALIDYFLASESGCRTFRFGWVGRRCELSV